MPPIADDAAAHFHELLADGWPAVHEALLRGTAAGGISFLGRPVVRALRPLFVGAREYADGCRAAALIGRAVNRLARRLAGDAGLRRALRLDPLQERLVAAEPDPEPMVARIDGFLTDGGTLRVLEYNPIPFGTIFSQAAAEIFAAMPIMGLHRRRFPARFVPTAERLIETLARAHARRGRGGRRLPNVAVVMGAAGAARVTETEGAHMMALAARAGAAVRAVAADSVVRDGEGLRAEGFPIDCLTFGDNGEFLRHFPEGHPVWTALREGEVWLFGALAATALHGNKCLLALMSDPGNAAWFSPEEREAIRRHLPWTRIVADAGTGRPGAAVAPVDGLRRNRERLVLKPATDFGGRGVVLGWRASEAEWEAALGEAVRHPYVVQARVPDRVERFPFAEDGDLRLVGCNVDFDPFLWSGDACAGALARVSREALLNITAGGGSLVPVMILDESSG
jgi:hypothetical protein